MFSVLKKGLTKRICRHELREIYGQLREIYGQLREIYGQLREIYG